MEVSNFDKLVNTVTKRVIDKNYAYTKSLTKNSDKSTLIIFPNVILGINEYMSYINEEYKDYNIYFSSYEKTLDALKINKESRITFDVTNPDFIRLVDTIDKVVIIGPKIDMLKALAQTSDTEDVNHIIVERVMQNKAVTILINSNGNIQDLIAGVVNSVRKLGVDVVNIQNEQGKSLLNGSVILEKDIMQLKNSGLKTVTLSPNQKLSPLAKDRLREYKINIEYIKEDHK